MKIWPPWTHRLPVGESGGNITREGEQKTIGGKNGPAEKQQSGILCDEMELY